MCTYQWLLKSGALQPCQPWFSLFKKDKFHTSEKKFIFALDDVRVHKLLLPGPKGA